MKKWILVIGLLIAVQFYYFLPEKKIAADAVIDRIMVFKSDERMEVYSGDQLLKTYSISIGKNSKGDKEYEGDKRTPEGTYIINDKNPNSGYHKNLGISYPNESDKKEAKQNGVSPGGEIKIHGIRDGLGFIGKFHRFMNWTAGCIALTNDEVDELYQHVPLGTPITISP